MDLVTSCKTILAKVCVYNPVVLKKMRQRTTYDLNQDSERELS